jgi:hypothetical protein
MALTARDVRTACARYGASLIASESLTSEGKRVCPEAAEVALSCAEVALSCAEVALSSAD